MQKILRTPDKHFENLPAFPYAPNYLTINNARVHYIAEGNPNGETILCLHGEPSWSYLYRKFIPILAPHYQVFAMDFIGFGRSDKYTDINDYTFSMHYHTLQQFIEQKNLTDITLVVQDWGGLLGLSMLGAMPQKFKRVVIMNTALALGTRKLPLAFKLWRAFAKYMPNIPIGGVIKMGTARKLSAAVKKAYDAPFPSRKYKAGAMAFPLLIPTSTSDEGVAEMKKAKEVLMQWTKPALVLFSDKDPIMRGGDRFFRRIIPSAKQQPNRVIKNAGHFLQEDSGEEIARFIHEFMQNSK